MDTISSTHTSRRSFLKGTGYAAGLSLTSAFVGACGSSSKSEDIGKTHDEIVKKAKKEGHLNLVAYPKDWANYAEHFKAFKKKYGIDIKVSNPRGSSAEELKAIEKLKGQDKQPDVSDLGYTFSEPARQKDLIEKYKPTNFDKIPDQLKDSDGYWVAAYYGILVMGVNTKNVPVPKKITDLSSKRYHKKVALAGDPTDGASSLAGVFAASIANGGSQKKIEPGIEFFADLKKKGNFVSVSSVANGLSTEEASVVFDWNYNFLGIEDKLKKSGVKLHTVVPRDAVVGNYYLQPCTAASPNPNAARLWVDWLTSDEGSEIYARGGAVPARFKELKDKRKLSKAALSALPDAKQIDDLELPDAKQGTDAAKILNDKWGPQVAHQ